MINNRPFNLNNSIVIEKKIEMTMFFLKLCKTIKKTASYLSAIMLAFVAFILLVQVGGRFIFSYSFSWPEELSRYAMIWVVLLMAGVLVHDKELISVDFLDKLWPPKAIKYRNLLMRFFFAALFIVLTIEGFLQAIHSKNQTTIALEISWFWVYLSIPVGSFLVLIQIIFITIEDFYKKKINL